MTPAERCGVDGSLPSSYVSLVGRLAFRMVTVLHRDGRRNSATRSALRASGTAATCPCPRWQVLPPARVGPARAAGRHLRDGDHHAGAAARGRMARNSRLRRDLAPGAPCCPDPLPNWSVLLTFDAQCNPMLPPEFSIWNRIKLNFASSPLGTRLWSCGGWRS